MYFLSIQFFFDLFASQNVGYRGFHVAEKSLRRKIFRLAGKASKSNFRNVRLFGYLVLIIFFVSSKFKIQFC